jgi:hypothetical protein
MGLNGLTYITKKNISKLTYMKKHKKSFPVLFWCVCLSPSACGREAIIHLRVNYKRVEIVHIFN